MRNNYAQNVMVGISGIITELVHIINAIIKKLPNKTLNFCLPTELCTKVELQACVRIEIVSTAHQSEVRTCHHHLSACSRLKLHNSEIQDVDKQT